jgi:hypothetical protein
MGKLALVNAILIMGIASIVLAASMGIVGEEIVVKINVSAPFELDAESETNLQQISKKLIVQKLPEQCAKSFEARGECNVLHEIEDVYHCELIVTFLYKETDTAVLSRIKFQYMQEKVTVSVVEPEYKPKMDDITPPLPSEESELKEKKESSIETKISDVPEDPRDYEAILEKEAWTVEKIEEAEEKVRKQAE